MLLGVSGQKGDRKWGQAVVFLEVCSGVLRFSLYLWENREYDLIFFFNFINFFIWFFFFHLNANMLFFSILLATKYLAMLSAIG